MAYDPDNDGDNHDPNEDDTQGAIPTEDTENETDAPDSMQPAEQQPQLAQKRSSRDELQALVKAVSLYGFHSIGMKALSTRSFEDGGSTDEDEDVTGSVQSQDQFTPTRAETALNTREMALNKSGLGGAFKDAQQKRIDSARGAIPANQADIEQNEDEQRMDAAAKQRHPFSAAQKTMASGAASPNSFLATLDPEVQQGLFSKNGIGMLGDFFKGAQAMEPRYTRAIEYAVDPQGNMPPVERKMRMVQYAYDKGLQSGDPKTGMDMALGTLQHQRREYDMWRTAAAVKLDQSDMQAAIEAANKAFQAPFGENVMFAQSRDGVTATVTDENGKVQGSFNLTPSHFQHLLQNEGRFDSLVHDGVLGTLARLDSTNPGTAVQQTDQFGPAAPPADAQATGQGKGTRELTEDEKRFPIYQVPEALAQKGITPEQWKYGLSQGWTSADFMKQIQQDQPFQSREKIAGIAAQGRVDRQNAQNQSALDRVNTRERGSMERTELRENRMDTRAAAREQGRQERFDQGWEKRAQAAAQKLVQGVKSDPTAVRKNSIVRNLLTKYDGDPEGFKAGLKQYGLDYDRDILGPATGSQSAPTPQASGANAPTSQAGGLAPGTVVKGYRFKGGNPKDKANWEQQAQGQ